MHNWWIATLEHLGLLTREEAEHIANNIRLGIHRENYKDAYNELTTILAESPSRSQVVKKLVGDVESVKIELGKLKYAEPSKTTAGTGLIGATLGAATNPAPEAPVTPEPTPVVEEPAPEALVASQTGVAQSVVVTEPEQAPVSESPVTVPNPEPVVTQAPTPSDTSGQPPSLPTETTTVEPPTEVNKSVANATEA